MQKIIASLLLCLITASAQAVPIGFNNSAYTTFALADVDGLSDGPYDASSLFDTLPITSSANITANGGAASAEAMADTLLLNASTEASSSDGIASGSAVTTFLGEFTTTDGVLSLLLDFEDIVDGTGVAGATLAASLGVDGISLLDQNFFSTELIELDFPVEGGLTGTLELVLISSALAFPEGNFASDYSTVAFALEAVAVPAPATLVLIIGGLVVLIANRGKSRYR